MDVTCFSRITTQQTMFPEDPQIAARADKVRLQLGDGIFIRQPFCSILQGK